jgi:hypothetical protein
MLIANPFLLWKNGDPGARSPNFRNREYFMTLIYNQNGFKIRSCPQIIDLIYIILNLLLFGGIGITSGIDFSRFCFWNKNCPDDGMKNQENIVLKEKWSCPLVIS